jgi:hypothetical protein
MTSVPFTLYDTGINYLFQVPAKKQGLMRSAPKPEQASAGKRNGAHDDVG